MTANHKVSKIIKKGVLHFRDVFCSISQAAKLIGVTRPKLQKLIDNELLLWDQPKNKRVKNIEYNNAIRLKHPEMIPDFLPLHVKDTKLLQKEIDAARHRIGKQANIPPCAVIISFDLGDEKLNK